MKCFQNNQRIQVGESKHVLYGVTGTVSNLRIQDDGAWVTMDKVPEGTEDCFLFLDDKINPRRHDVLLFPDQCKAFRNC